jgi:exosortase B
MRAASRSAAAPAGAFRWWPLLLGLLGMYVPTYFNVYRVFWTSRDGSYGAIMFLLIAWLVWRQREVFRRPGTISHPVAGWMIFVFGLLCYIVGRSQSFYQLEVGSQIPVLLGLSLLALGDQAPRRLWFPIMLIVFVIPVPGSMADELLLPLKELVSRIVDNSLHFAGYPIARNGVVLTIGPYSLLIADACSGLNSMIALSGVGLVYAHLAQHARPWLNAALLASIVPIALAANILRVLGLVLVTYYAGDGVGTAFHDVASYLEVAFAFGAFFVLDYLLGRSSAAPASAGPQFHSKVVGK